MEVIPQVNVAISAQSPILPQDDYCIKCYI